MVIHNDSYFVANYLANIFKNQHFRCPLQRILKALAIAIAILDAFLLDYIYINRKRYKYITSSRYRPFKLSVNAGVGISILTFVVSFIVTLFLAVAADKFLKK